MPLAFQYVAGMNEEIERNLVTFVCLQDSADSGGPHQCEGGQS